jgi:hypothetical protein
MDIARPLDAEFKSYTKEQTDALEVGEWLTRLSRRIQLELHVQGVISMDAIETVLSLNIEARSTLVLHLLPQETSSHIRGLLKVCEPESALLEEIDAAHYKP